jgi:tryptophan synthase beta subunit
MATLNVMYATVGGGNNSAAAYEDFISAENVTTSGTAATSSIVAAGRAYARCTAVGGAMYVKPILSGATAVAVGTGAYIASGGIINLRVGKGWRISVIDAA